MKNLETVQRFATNASVATTCKNCGQVCVSVVEVQGKNSALCLVCSLGELLINRHRFNDKAQVLAILRNLSQSAIRKNWENGMRQMKLALKCAECGQDGSGNRLAEFASYGLQFAHLERGTKLRTKSGATVEPNKIIRTGYSLAIAASQMLVLSRVLCAYCHALETASESAKP